MAEYQARTGDPTVAAATYSGDKLSNIGEAFLNSLISDRDAYASKLAQRVLKDRTSGIIQPGEEINFIGVSGGATIAFNAAEILRRSFVTINNVAFIGGYVQRGVPGNVSNWIVVVSRWDQVMTTTWYLGSFTYVRVDDVPGHDAYLIEAYRKEVVDGIASNTK